MSYREIDPVIERWAGEHSLTIFRRFKDSEVRSVELVGRAGGRVQIWLDPVKESGKVGVHLWDYGKRTLHFEGPTENLRALLDQAYAYATSWTD